MGELAPATGGPRARRDQVPAHPQLAPTTKLRQLQYRKDHRLGLGKRSRVELAEQYRRRYLEQVLDRVNLKAVLASLADDSTSAQLCVERNARACHRSLVAGRLYDEYGVALLALDSARTGL